MATKVVGRRAPVMREIAFALGPAATYALSRDIPDVLGLADYVGAVEETLALVQRRVRAGLVGTEMAMFPLVKADPTTTRGLTVLDPLDDLALRVLVGRCSHAIAAVTDEAHVLNGVIRNPGPGWTTASYRAQHRRRRELQHAHVSATSTKAVGFFDIKNFFPSCGQELVCRMLHDAGAPVGAVDVLGETFARMFDGSGQGLPIGFEGSGPIANLMLRPMDAAIGASGRPYIRWTDDVEVFIQNRTEWTMIVEAAQEAVSSVGLSFNLDKTKALPVGGEAEAHLFDPTRDSIFNSDDPVTEIAGEFGWAAMWKTFGSSGDMPPGRFRAFLGKLARVHDPGALEFLAAYPLWINREPRPVADYLIALMRHSPTMSLVDRDWLVELATVDTVRRTTAAGQLHLFRALATVPVGRDHGKKFLDFATDHRRINRYGELAAWAMRAWSQSDHWNPTDALDLVSAYRPASLRRAALAGFIRKPPGRSKVSGLRRRAALDDSLGPVVRLVMPA